MERTGTFSRTMSLRAWAQSKNGIAFDAVKNPHTGKIFGVLKTRDGQELTLAIAEKVGTDLNQDLSVSWFEPNDGADGFYMLHQTGKSNVVASVDFSADLNKV